MAVHMQKQGPVCDQNWTQTDKRNSNLDSFDRGNTLALREAEKIIRTLIKALMSKGRNEKKSKYEYLSHDVEAKSCACLHL